MVGTHRTNGAIRRRAALRVTVRSCATSAIGLGIYFWVPLDAVFTTGTVLTLAGCLTVVLLVVLQQAWVIVGSSYPRLRAVQALATVIPLYLLLFASAHCVMENSDVSAYSEPLSRLDALYFTITVFSSVGFGDVAPRTEPARTLTMAQMLGDLVIVGLVVQVLLGAVRQGLDRRNAREG
ncbi:potassium channel family protein [Actinocorallia longicatena]|uniref:Potassium channel family protein n=1 Tax=Actinocorallia longicatena TaxID=111803 RepID=A0ABP6Q5N9_9ACTN